MPLKVTIVNLFMFLIYIILWYTNIIYSKNNKYMPLKGYHLLLQLPVSGCTSDAGEWNAYGVTYNILVRRWVGYLVEWPAVADNPQEHSRYSITSQRKSFCWITLKSALGWIRVKPVMKVALTHETVECGGKGRISNQHWACISSPTPDPLWPVSLK